MSPEQPVPHPRASAPAAPWHVVFEVHMTVTASDSLSAHTIALNRIADDDAQVVSLRVFPVNLGHHHDH